MLTLKIRHCGLECVEELSGKWGKFKTNSNYILISLHFPQIIKSANQFLGMGNKSSPRAVSFHGWENNVIVFEVRGRVSQQDCMLAQFSLYIKAIGVAMLAWSRKMSSPSHAITQWCILLPQSVMCHQHLQCQCQKGGSKFEGLGDYNYTVLKEEQTALWGTSLWLALPSAPRRDMMTSIFLLCRPNLGRSW